MPRRALADLEARNFDIIIIGAGINGASCAQHLTAAGYSVLLVDKADFRSGSTSRSTRMLHCGLRYFETPNPVLDFVLAPRKLMVALRMAKASMRVRGEIVKDSPERVRKIKLLFPIFRDGPYKEWQVDLAFKVLGSFGPSDVPLDYERIAADQCGALPFIKEMRDPAQLRSVAMFSEYMFEWPERLCIDAVLNAEAMGAEVRNHTEAAIGEKNSEEAWCIGLTDMLNREEKAAVTAPIILNMAGIWIDRVNKRDGAVPRRLILGTKGSHGVVKLPDTFRDHGIATVNSHGEPHYCLPSQGGYHHIGPTETVYEGDIDDIRVDASDRSFLLGETQSVLPGLGLSDDDVVYTWAGVRPLGFDPAYLKGKRSVEIHGPRDTGQEGVYAMTAGPLMTHRTAGRDMTEIIAGTLKPSGGGRALDYTPRKFPENRNSPALSDRHPDVTLADVAHAAATEHAVSLVDILISRTGALYVAGLGDDDMRRAAEAASVSLGWDSDEVDRQIELLKAKLAETYEMS